MIGFLKCCYSSIQERTKEWETKEVRLEGLFNKMRPEILKEEYESIRVNGKI